MEQIDRVDEIDNGMADTRDVKPKFEEEKEAFIQRSNITTAHYLQWLNINSQEGSAGKLEPKKKRDVVANALRAGSARKYVSSTNRRMSENNVLGKFNSEMEEELGQSSTNWCPPTNTDLATPQGKMLINLGGKLRAMMVANQSKKELTPDFGQVRNCRSYGDVNEESEKMMADMEGQNANSAEKLGDGEERLLDRDTESLTKIKTDNRAATAGNNGHPEFHDIAEKQKMISTKSPGLPFSIGSKFFRSRAKSEFNNKRETLYKDE